MTGISGACRRYVLIGCCASSNIVLGIFHVHEDLLHDLFVKVEATSPKVVSNNAVHWYHVLDLV